MSLFRYKVAISDEGDYCFSITNNFTENYDDKLELEDVFDYHEELDRHDELDYEYFGGTPICHVLRWVGPTTGEEDSAFDQIGDMAKRKRTPWRLKNIAVCHSGEVELSFDLACAFNYKEHGNRVDQTHSITVKDDSFFSIILETRSDGFSVTRYGIKRHRSDFNKETTIEVSERAGSYFRHLLFHFPDRGNAYCDVAEYRR